MAARPVNDHGTDRLGETLDARAFRLWAGAGFFLRKELRKS